MISNAHQYDIVVGSLYDTLELRSMPPTTQPMFAFPIGMNGKTKEHTNMLMAGRLPAPQQMEIKTNSISFTY